MCYFVIVRYEGCNHDRVYHVDPCEPIRPQLTVSEHLNFELARHCDQKRSMVLNIPRCSDCSTHTRNASMTAAEAVGNRPISHQFQADQELPSRPSHQRQSAQTGSHHRTFGPRSSDAFSFVYQESAPSQSSPTSTSGTRNRAARRCSGNERRPATEREHSAFPDPTLGRQDHTSTRRANVAPPRREHTSTRADSPRRRESSRTHHASSDRHERDTRWIPLPVSQLIGRRPILVHPSARNHRSNFSTWIPLPVRQPVDRHPILVHPRARHHHPDNTESRRR